VAGLAFELEPLEDREAHRPSGTDRSPYRCSARAVAAFVDRRFTLIGSACTASRSAATWWGRRR